MGVSIGTVVLAYLLILISLANLLIKPVILLRRMAGKILKAVLKIEVPKNEKKSLERLYTPLWIIIGLWAFWKLKDRTLLGAFFGLLAFRSGANITRLLVYSKHDAKILTEMAEGKILDLLGRAIKLSLLLEAAFPLALVLAYKTLSAVTLSGGSVGRFLLELWSAGAIFGLLFGYIIARNNRGLLLEDSIDTLIFIMAARGKKKAEKAKDFTKRKLRFRTP